MTHQRTSPLAGLAATLALLLPLIALGIFTESKGEVSLKTPLMIGLIIANLLVPVLGVIALARIERSGGRLKGRVGARIAIVTLPLVFAVLLAGTVSQMLLLTLIVVCVALAFALVAWLAWWILGSPVD